MKYIPIYLLIGSGWSLFVLYCNLRAHGRLIDICVGMAFSILLWPMLCLAGILALIDRLRGLW